MRNKWIIRLSLLVNILIITVLVIIGYKFKGNTVNTLISNEENVAGISSGNRADSAILTTARLAKSGFKWPEGKKMALSLTFDDGIQTQIDNGIPLFDKYGVKATFYVSLWHAEKRIDDWKNAINNGHEVGNHTCKHPCTVNYDFTKDNPLEDYTLKEMSRELYSENEVLEKLLGEKPRSFAYPCGQTFIGRGLNTRSYVPLISAIFESGRGYTGGFTNPELCDMANLPAEHLDGRSFEEIKALIDTAMVTGKWMIFAGHGISEGDMNDTQLSTLEAICRYALDPANGIWIDNIHNIASYVREKRGEEPFVQNASFKNPGTSLYSTLWSDMYVLKLKAKAIKNELN